MQKGLFYFLILMLLPLIGCDSESGEAVEPLPLDAWMTLKVGDKEIQSQLAIHRAEQSKGLMFREQLAEDAGMLFLYRVPQQVSFYMKNTPLPLDIGFFNSDGILLEIRRMMPYDTTSIRSRSDQVQFALEMNQGWFSRYRLYPGTRLDLNLLARAIRARGATPQEYGLREKD